MLTHPRISIVTPSFNDAKYLDAAIQSVVSQSYPNLEYIIMDGGSTDGSVEIIKKYEKHLTYWVSEKDNGMYHALQKGFKRTTGEIMGWLNSDDVHQPGSLHTIAQIFSDYKKINWLQGMPNGIDKAGRIVYATPRPEIDKFFFYNKKHIQSHKYIQQESTFWRRNLWGTAGGFISERYKFAGDFELWIRFFRHEQLFNTRSLLASFRLTGEEQFSVTNYQEYADETVDILNGYPLNAKEQKELRYSNIMYRVEKKLLQLCSKLRNKMGITQCTVINNTIHFDNQSQKFRADL